MRRGLTLIELIFTMVIVAVTFTVIPKLIQALSSANEVSVKEDAIFNTMALMGMIARLPWDASNETNSQILRVSDGDSRFDCNATTFYRNGGFEGGRLCKEYNAMQNATPIGKESDGFLNDIDDYDEESLDTFISCGGKLYNLHVKVSYKNDNNPLVAMPAGETSNTKHIEITTGYDSASKYKKDYDFCVMFDYFSYNIGYATIKKRLWQ